MSLSNSTSLVPHPTTFERGHISLPISRCSGSSCFVVLTHRFLFWTSRILSPWVFLTCQSSFVKSACKLIFSGAFSPNVLCTILKPTTIALPLASTLALTTDVQFVTSRLLRYLAVAHATHAKPRSGAIRSCCQVILSSFIEKVPEDTLKPLIIEACRLRTVARKMGKSHVPTRGLHSVLATLHLMMVIARHVTVGHQSYVFHLWPSRNPVMFAWMLALLCTKASCQKKTTSVTAVSCARFLQASTLVGIYHYASCRPAFWPLSVSRKSLFERRYLWWIQAPAQRHLV